MGSEGQGEAAARTINECYYGTEIATLGFMTGTDSKHMDLVRSRWLQVFDLRVPLAERDRVEPLLFDLVQDANVRSSLDIQFYRHCEIATDWSVHVRYTRDVTESGRQTLGSTILASLEALGSVYASTWERIEVRD